MMILGMKALDFDASIDLCGNASKGAVDQVRQAVEGLAGAHWISVEWCGPLPTFEGDMQEIPADRWLRVWRWGSGQSVNAK
jgi:hypothetical protein